MIGSPSWINVGTTPFGLSLKYAGSYWSAQRHDVILGLQPLFLQRDANLLGAYRVDVVIEFQHVILPFFHSAETGSATRSLRLDILYRMIYNVNFRVLRD